MTNVRQYSNLFTCLYDEEAPIGSIGRGCHYSIFRSVEWLDVNRRRLEFPQIHDFAVIWDEDHDDRIIRAIERIYMAGLLSPIQFIGERKGHMTAIVAAKFYWGISERDLERYREAVEINSKDPGDPWPVEIGSFDRQPGSPHQTFFEGLINASEHRVGLFLRNIDSLWNLGTKYYQPIENSSPFSAPPPFPLIPLGPQE